MACVIFVDPEGNRRVIPLGAAFRRKPGEHAVGKLDDCGIGSELVNPADVLGDSKLSVSGLVPNDLPKLRAELNIELGSGYGDMIKTLAAPVAKMIGKSNCTACEVRRVIANAYGKLKARYGMIEALRLMKGLWQDTFDKKITEEETLLKLRQFLAGTETK